MKPTRWISSSRVIYLGVVMLGVVMVTTQIVTAQSDAPSLDSPQGAAQRSVATASMDRTYLLGPDDQILIRAIDAGDISDKPIRIDTAGNIRLPLVGRIHAGGLTVEELEGELAEHLRTYVQRPDVTVSITEFGSHPVSVLGFVRNPGLYQIHGQRSLVEVIALAGGVREDAGDRVKITRPLRLGPIPLQDATTDASAQLSVAEVSLSSVVEATHPGDNFLIQAEDVVSVPKADMVYVLGEVHKAGGFVVRDGPSSVSVALALAEGWLPTAAPDQARLLRVVPGSAERTQLNVNIKKVMAGKAPDVRLQAGDILFIPNSKAKSATLRTLETAIQIGTGIAIFHP